MKQLLCVRSARHARLFRLVNDVFSVNSKDSHDGERLCCVNSHIKRDIDVNLSRAEEILREKLIPLKVGDQMYSANNQSTHGNLFHFREYPMYPGEYIPAAHNTLSSLRYKLQTDLTAQSLRDAWSRVSRDIYFNSVDDYYSAVEGLDEAQVGEIIAAVLPRIKREDANALVSQVLQSLSKGSSAAVCQIGRAVTAEAVGLDSAPGHYTNFLEWMGKIAETKAFKTELSLFEFSRRKFNRDDVRTMFENYNTLSKSALDMYSTDCYSHFYAVLRNFAQKVAGEDTRQQIGVRIDPPEVDASTGLVVGHGCADGEKFKFSALLRENCHGNGSITILGKPISTVFDDKSWLIEMILMPFDEAQLNYRDFDVNIVHEGSAMPSIASEISAFACRMAVSNAITKLLPLTRIPLKKAGLLSVDRRRERGQFPGYIDGKRQKRKFAKR